MRRRDLLAVAVVGTAALRSLAVRAQQKTMPMVGFLHATVPGPNVVAFRQGLSETGYLEGKQVDIEYRWAEGDYDRLPAMAADLVFRNVDVIATGGGTPAAQAAKNATSTIPIVFAGVGDPVAIELVESRARPNGNITGMSFLAPELLPKRLELLCELLPQAKVIASLINPSNAANAPVIPALQQVARVKGIDLHILNATNEAEIDAAFARVRQLQASALLVGADPYFVSRREHFVGLAARNAVPAFYAEREFSDAGGLISYAPVSLLCIARRVFMSGESSRAPNQPTCRSSSRPSSSW